MSRLIYTSNEMTGSWLGTIGHLTAKKDWN